MTYTFDPMDEASARSLFEWRYEPPYDIYNLDPENADEGVPFFVDLRNAYYQITDQGGSFEAYCCFGADGQVPGGEYSGDALDIGMGIRPDLTGQGQGLAYATAVLDFGRSVFAPSTFRVTVARFNQRARRVWEKVGFQQTQSFERSLDGLAFVILTRTA